MNYQDTFTRTEIKFLVTGQEKSKILKAMEPHMHQGEFGSSTIRNIYFDTPDYRLIRNSIDKPLYKEKFRIRSYSQAKPNDPVFVEIKKKFDSVVYKRRLTLPEYQARRCMQTGLPFPVDSQIGNEIEYFREFYKDLEPSVFISYDREAYSANDGSDLRVTFDDNILYRTEDFSMNSGIYGTPVIGNCLSLMEIKTNGGIPLWLTKVLSDNHIYKTSFSKYGSAYEDMMIKKTRGGVRYA